MISWLVCSTLERAVLVRAVAGDIVSCSSTRHVTLTVPLSTQCDFTFFTLFVGYGNSGQGPLPSFQHVIEKLHMVARS